VIRLLDGIVDIYLPDFKYQDGTLAAKYSASGKDYPQVAAKVSMRCSARSAISRSTAAVWRDEAF
jgi:putative pyruvate formate lyase activating enzyme